MNEFAPQLVKRLTCFVNNVLSNLGSEPTDFLKQFRFYVFNNPGGQPEVDYAFPFRCFRWLFIIVVLLKISQHEFMKGRSCLTNLLDFFEEVYDELDTNNQVDLVYLDFAKAFDKVPHKRLIRKMQACGIRGSVLQWIIKWLKNRRQRVRIRGKDSKWINITSGVPQGSVLGPLLFVIYINDIDGGIVSKISKFADDTKLCARVNNEEDANALRGDLDKLHKWSRDWNMPFNMDKCAVMHVGRSNCRFEFEMDNRRIRQTEEEKDLGVYSNT